MYSWKKNLVHELYFSVEHAQSLLPFTGCNSSYLVCKKRSVSDMSPFVCIAVILFDSLLVWGMSVVHYSLFFSTVIKIHRGN